MNLILRYKIQTLILLVILVFGINGVFFVFVDKSLSNITFEVKRGESFNQILRNLSEQEIIKNKFWFKVYVYILGEQSNLKAGKYIFDGKFSANSVLWMLVNGQGLGEDIVVVIPEGLNVWELDQKLSDSKLIDKGNFVLAAKNLEGYLFPDTYRFDKDSLVEEVVNKLKENFDNRIKGSNLKVTREILILASILEKEVKTTEDMQIVAGIFKKRMELDWPLEVDATVAYGVCGSAASLPKTKLLSTFFNGIVCDVSKVPIREYLNFESAYNTYKYRGLPPGPISNPGLRSIQAALNPIDSPYFYYLTTRDGSQVIFSRTLQEHSVARKKHLGP